MESDPSARFERFGHPDFDWSADVSLRPALVAAVYHQHRLVLAARTRVGATFTAALVARRLASLRGDGEPTEAAVRKASRWLSGQQPLSAADELEWREIFDLGDEPETRLRRLHDLDAYPPSFAQSLLVFGDSIAFIERHSVHWQSLGAAIRDAVEADNARLPIGFVTSSVLRGHVVRALIAAGVDRDLLRPQAGGLVVLDTVPVTVVIRAAISDSDESYNSLLRLLVRPQKCDVLVLALGGSPWSRLRRTVAELRASDGPDDFTVPPAAYGALGVAMPPSEAWWRVESMSSGTQVHVVALSRKRSSR